MEKLKYIRESTLKEIEDIKKELSINLYNSYYWSFFDTNYYCELLSDNDGFRIKYMSILDDDNLVVGLVQISRKNPRTTAKMGFVVLEKYSGNGFGTRAIREALTFCSMTGIGNMLTSTSTQRLKQYYEEHFGFETVGMFKKWTQMPNSEFRDKYYLQLLI